MQPDKDDRHAYSNCRLLARMSRLSAWCLERSFTKPYVHLLGHCPQFICQKRAQAMPTWIWCSGRLSLLGMSTDRGCPGAGSFAAAICSGVGVAVTAAWRCAMAAGGLALARHCFSAAPLVSGRICAKSSTIGRGSLSPSLLSCFRLIISTCTRPGLRSWTGFLQPLS